MTQTATAPIRKKFKKKSQFKETWRRFKKNKIAIVGLAIFSVILLCTIFADLIVPYKIALEQNMAVRLQTPSASHWFGTDIFGRDIFARIIHGTRNSLVMGIGAVALGISLGSIFGAVAGFYGGKVDTFIMRIMDTVISMPYMLLALALVAALGPGLVNLLIALTLANVPYFTRLIRSAILTVIGQDFIEAAKACGTPDYNIILMHILPNAIGIIIVQTTMSVGLMILNAASMSYLGMGIQPPIPEWGSMLTESKNYMMNSPHLVIIPGITIVLVALSLNMMGDGLRDALDPRLKD